MTIKKKGPKRLFRRFVGDGILPRSIGDYKINHYHKDPKQTTSIVEESKRVFFVAQMIPATG